MWLTDPLTVYNEVLVARLDFNDMEVRAFVPASRQIRAYVPELVEAARELGISPSRLVMWNNDFIALDLTKGVHPAFLFIVTSLADAEVAASTYVREHSKAFYILRIEAKLDVQLAPVVTTPWEAK